MSALAEALKGGGKYLKWEQPGTAYTGTIADVALRQARKYESTELDFWDDGTPKMQVVLTLDTDYRDPEVEDDDGSRQLTINLWSGQKKALMQACKAAGVSEPQKGMTFTAMHVSGVGNAKSPRVFEYVLAAGPTSVAAALAEPEQPAQANTGELARQLLAAGADVDTVAKATGLPATTVAALANAVKAG